LERAFVSSWPSDRAATNENGASHVLKMMVFTENASSVQTARASFVFSLKTAFSSESVSFRGVEEEESLQKNSFLSNIRHYPLIENSVQMHLWQTAESFWS
jgi:hypothetical protein